MKEINFNLDEGRISSINITEEKLEIIITTWNGQNLRMIIKDYTKLHEYNSVGREISKFEVLSHSSLLEIERNELRNMDFDEEELNNLVHLNFWGFSELPLLDVILDKHKLNVIKL